MAEIFRTDQTWLRCIKCGYGTDLLKERLFKCPICNSLYDVVHNFSDLGKTFEELKMIFNARANPMGVGNTNDPKRNSGV